MRDKPIINGCFECIDLLHYLINTIMERQFNTRIVFPVFHTRSCGYICFFLGSLGRPPSLVIKRIFFSFPFFIIILYIARKGNLTSSVRSITTIKFYSSRYYYVPLTRNPRRTATTVFLLLKPLVAAAGSPV